MEQSSGRPATRIEIEAFNSIARLQDENRELKQKIQTLIDAADQAEAERLDACDCRNIAYIELEDVQAENGKLREMAKAMVKWEQVALEMTTFGPDDPLDRAFQSGLMLSLATRLAKEVLGEGEVKLDILKRAEQLFNEAERESQTLASLMAAAQVVIEQADLDAATRSPYGVAATFGFYEVVLTAEQVETLRAALAAAAAVQINP